MTTQIRTAGETLDGDLPTNSGADTVEQRHEIDEMRSSGNFCIASGVGVGALGLGAAAIGGAICPLCYIVTPLLVGTGVVQRVRATRQAKRNKRLGSSRPLPPS